MRAEFVSMSIIDPESAQYLQLQICVPYKQSARDQQNVHFLAEIC